MISFQEAQCKGICFPPSPFSYRSQSLKGRRRGEETGGTGRTGRTLVCTEMNHLVTITEVRGCYKLQVEEELLCTTTDILRVIVRQLLQHLVETSPYHSCALTLIWLC